MFERRDEALLPKHRFSKRLLVFAGASALLVCASLALGMAGYHFLAGLPWVDSFVNASMILTGMGPVDRMDNTPAKLFSGFYALFSGIVLIGTAAVLLAPWVHRLLHRLHADEDDEKQDEKRDGVRKR